eukprot:4299839-Prymnesium_polylepis.1
MGFLVLATVIAVSPVVTSRALNPAQVLESITSALSVDQQARCVASGKGNASQLGEDLSLLPYLLAITGGKPG